LKLKLLAVGRKMPAWVSAGYQEYSGRLPRHCPLVLQAVEAGKRGPGVDPGRAMQIESSRLLKALAPDDWVVTLEIAGKPWSTEQLAQQYSRWLQTGRDVVFMVGGPEGLGSDCLARADQRWSLGPLTLPHPLVRVVLAEQLYRAWTILNHHPYHRG